ncbi:MAG: viral A-type inclusion protein, partial [Clostridium butyricum]|nr:viral A-type inclusion protein [Clostridium butyricum]
MAIFDLKANIDLKQNLNLYTTCKQLDSLNLILSVFDNSVQTNLTNYNVRLKAMKADKVPLVQEHTGISISGNVITIETDEQLTTTSGKTLIELQFIDKGTGKKKATFNLVLIVVPSVLEVDRSISKATYTLLEELENKLDQASDFFENIEDAIVANNNLKKTISNSETAESNLETAITNANNKKNEVDEAITIATNKIEEVEQSIINANNSKTELDASKTIADTTKIDLDNANVQAEKNIEELNKLGDATDLAAKVQTNTENISKNNKSIEEVNSQMNENVYKPMSATMYKLVKTTTTKKIKLIGD